MAIEGFFAKLSLVTLLGATVCLIIGLATPYWVSNSGHISGLWQYCYYLTHAGGARTCIAIDDRPDFEDWIKGVRAVEIIACIGGALGVLFLIIYNIKNDGQANLNRIKFVMLLCLLSCILSIIGIGIYGAKRNNGYFGRNKNYSWSFYMSAISGCFMGLIIVPLAIEIRQARRLGVYESI